jgi:cyclic beta-1,2-glucan synthetase
MAADLTLAEWSARCDAVRRELAADPTVAEPMRIEAAMMLERAAGNATSLAARLAGIARDAHAFFVEMDFRFLYDPARKLFSIGYQVDNARLDPSY